MSKYLEFAKKVGLEEDNYYEIFENFKSKLGDMDEKDKEDLANFQILRYLKKMQLNPLEWIECVYLGNGGLRESANGKFRVLYFAYNNEIYTALLDEDKFVKIGVFDSRLRKIKIKASLGNGKFFFNDLSIFKTDDSMIIENPIEFFKSGLSSYIEKDLNKLLIDNRNFVVISANVLSLDIFTSRAQVLLMDDNLSPENTISMWIDIDEIDFTDMAKGLIIAGNTYINKDGICMINQVYVNVPNEYKKIKVEEIKEETQDDKDLDAFL